MPSASLGSKYGGYKGFYGIESSPASSLPNRNHRIDRAVSLGQDGNGPALPQGAALPPGAWRLGLCQVKRPSLPGIPAKMPGLQISLTSEEALCRG